MGTRLGWDRFSGEGEGGAVAAAAGGYGLQAGQDSGKRSSEGVERQTAYPHAPPQHSRMTRGHNGG